MYRSIIAILFICTLSSSCSGEQNVKIKPQEKIVCGADQTELYFPVLMNKSIGIVANHTSMIGETHLVDSLLHSQIRITTIFAPEHGFRGTADAGEHIKDGKDPRTGIPVTSLYGNNKKPTTDQLKNIDLIIFDIQDVGARFYTYISTMHYVMEACAENNIKMLILDRPNPNGSIIDGPVLNPEYSSFVGMHPVPIAHGMTIGEYAQMINGEGWLNNNLKCELEVIPCKNYTHNMKYSLPIPPSPNLPNDRSIELYPSICLFEATSLSVGRGTNNQFQIIGHPLLEGFGNFSFTPQSNHGSKYPKHKNTTCYGYDLRKVNSIFPEIEGQINLSFLTRIYSSFPNKEVFFKNPKFFDKLAGGPELRKQLESNMTEKEIRETWASDLIKFKETRSKYLIYD